MWATHNTKSFGCKLKGTGFSPLRQRSPKSGASAPEGTGYSLTVNPRFLPLSALAFALLLAGCHSHPSAANTPEVRAEQRAEAATEREQLDMIPPPTKSRFMAVRSIESWQNPSITVQPGMLELHVTVGDANPSPIGAGGMLRPVAAREQELNISLDKLGEAISSIPQSAWPYGRVIALEEPSKTPPQAEPQVRRNMEVAINKLNDLGVVVYDLKDGLVR